MLFIQLRGLLQCVRQFVNNPCPNNWRTVHRVENGISPQHGGTYVQWQTSR